MDTDLELVYKCLFMESESRCNVSVFISGAEHIGTSWCALNLAYALNLKNKRILLVDGNGNFSNISSFLNMVSPLYLDEYIQGKKTLNQLINAYKNQNFNILTSSPGSSYLAEQPLGRIHILAGDLQILAKDYSHTIIDIGTEISQKNFGLCQIADNIIVVCSEKSSDLVKTFDVIRFMSHFSFDTNFKLIINKVTSFDDGYKIYKELCKALTKSKLNTPELLGIVRVDTRIRDAVRNKELLLTRYPSSEAAVDICNIAKKLETGE